MIALLLRLQQSYMEGDWDNLGDDEAAERLPDDPHLALAADALFSHLLSPRSWSRIERPWYLALHSLPSCAWPAMACQWQCFYWVSKVCM